MLTWSLTTPFHRSAITPWNCRDVADGSAVVWGSVPGPDVLGVEGAGEVVVVEGPGEVVVVEGPAVVVVGPCWCTLEVAARGAGEGRAPYAT